MIELYYWPTPNGHKITMFLEEAELEYAIHPVDISAGVVQARLSRDTAEQPHAGDHRYRASRWRRQTSGRASVA
jgi:hypothetical protein